MGHYSEERDRWEEHIAMERAHYAKKKVPVHMLAIAASGPGAGKDTLFKLLDNHGFDVVNVKFADALTEEVQDMMGANGYYEFEEIRHDATMKDHPFRMFAIDRLRPSVYKNFLKESGLDPTEKRSARWHMIQYGTHFMREHLGRDDYWLLKGIEKAKEVYLSGKIPVITDVRFPNELLKLHLIGAESVFLFSPWSTKDGGVADGLIRPSDCNRRFTNTKGKPEDLLKQFLQFYTMKMKGDH